VTTLDELFRSRIATVIPDVIAASDAGELRARLAPRYTRYALFDRGSYEVAVDLEEPEWLARIAAIATELTARTLAPIGMRAIRLCAGDYLLARHDTIHDDGRVEATLDISAAATPDAGMYYRRHGNVYAHVPSAPGSLAVVERDAAITCSHNYVSKLHVHAEITRVIVQFRSA
jgi:hypothetical protein